jgi:RHS repeat-associated protein
VSFAYDANGNTVEKSDNGQITRYNYNLEDRLSCVEDGQGALIAEYYYDPFGRRLWKDVDGERLYFVYSDEGLVGELNTDGQVNREYGYKPNSIWTTDPLFLRESGQYYFYQNDHVGTPHNIYSTSGAFTWSAEYGSFGETTTKQDSVLTNNLRFAGQYYDQETGLHYNYFRYYDPNTGRYLRTDPIGLAGGIRLYAYVSNNPITSIDPFGLREWTINRYGGSVSAVVVGLSGQRVKFISNCENNIRITTTYLVLGLGLTVGLEASVWGGPNSEDQSKGYFGDTNVYESEPKPVGGIFVSGPSAGIVATGGTLGSASLDFSSYAEVYGATSGKSLGASLFTFEGQGYFHLSTKTERCCE